jgi:hypothetical protein
LLLMAFCSRLAAHAVSFIAKAGLPALAVTLRPA